MLEFDLNVQLRKAGGQLPKPLFPSQHPIHHDSPSEKEHGSQPGRPILGSNLRSLPSIISASGTTAGPRRSSPIPPVHAKAPTGAKTRQSKSRKSRPDAQEKKKKQKLSEKQIQNRMPAPLPESRLYTELLEFEARIHVAAARKEKAIRAALCRDLSMHRMLRIYIFNTFSNQAPGTAEPEPPSWSLKITGRILEDEIMPQNLKPLYPKFSSFFKKIVVILDKHLYPDDPVIIWESSRSATPVEGFEIKRKGDKEFTAIIQLEMSFVPEEFWLSPSLKELLGIAFNTRAGIIARLFNYVKRKRLQNPRDPTEFVCDAPLKRVFGENTMKFASVPQKISRQLSAMPPIEIRHHIRISGNAPGIDTCYDVLAKVPHPGKKEVQINLHENKEMMESRDKVTNTYLKAIHERQKKRAIYLRFGQSPEYFIHEVIASQSGNLNLIGGEATSKHLADRCNQPW